MWVLIPLTIGVIIGLSLFYTVGWWGFLFIFPWIGLSISLGVFLQSKLPKNKKAIGRKISILCGECILQCPVGAIK